ncbi:DUF4190 domain-containing protein [Thalassiella azotivora]
MTEPSPPPAPPTPPPSDPFAVWQPPTAREPGDGTPETSPDAGGTGASTSTTTHPSAQTPPPPGPYPYAHHPHPGSTPAPPPAHAAAPHAAAPYAADPYAAAPYAADPYAAAPYATNPYALGPYAHHPHGYPGPGYPAHPVAPPAGPTSGTAVAALVTGVLGLVPVALALGTVALVRIRRSGAAGTGFAVGGMVAAAAWTVVGALVAVAFLGFSDLDDPWPPAGPAAVVADLDVGDCYTLPGRGQTSATAVPCSSPHDGEVYHRWTLTPSASSSEDDLRWQADDRCWSRFASYVGTAWEDSELSYEYYLADPAERADGVRDATCVVVPWEDESLSGSARGSGR